VCACVCVCLCAFMSKCICVCVYVCVCVQGVWGMRGCVHVRTFVRNESHTNTRHKIFALTGCMIHFELQIAYVRMSGTIT
jgi:hypothetical protein